MKTDISKNFIGNVKLIAKVKGIKIGNIEKHIGVSNGYLSRVENGSGEITLKNAVMIAGYIDTDLKELLETDCETKIIDMKIAELEREIALLKGERDHAETDSCDSDIHCLDNTCPC